MRRKQKVAAMLIVRFGGDVERLKEAYDRPHALIMSRRGATQLASCDITVPSGMTLSTSSACGSPKN